jgi:hypothetical protein
MCQGNFIFIFHRSKQGAVTTRQTSTLIEKEIERN